MVWTSRKMLEYQLSLHKQDPWFMETSFILCHIFIKAASDLACKIKQNFSTKASSFESVFLCVLWVQLTLLQKENYLLNGLVFVSSSGLWFAAVEYRTGISLCNSDIPFPFFPNQFPRLYFTSGHFETLYCSFSLVWELSELMLSTS